MTQAYNLSQLANKVNTSGQLDVATGVTGTQAVANGGTGQSTYTNGQLLIGNTTGNTLTKATLTAGTNITITNGNGSITIDAAGGAPTTAQVLSATAGASAGAVGTYMFADTLFGMGSISFGSTYAGSNLRPTSGGGTPQGSYQSGTWRSMGQANPNDTPGRNSTLFLRVS